MSTPGSPERGTGQPSRRPEIVVAPAHPAMASGQPDIHQHGVVVGVADGIGDGAANTGKDFAKVGTGIAHGVERVWDSIF